MPTNYTVLYSHGATLSYPFDSLMSRLQVTRVSKIPNLIDTTPSEIILGGCIHVTFCNTHNVMNTPGV